MADLNVFVKWPDGSPAGDQLVFLVTAMADNFFEFGMPIYPNPRRTSGDGGVNFYHGGPLPRAISVQFTCQNGTSDPVTFDGTSDVVVQLGAIPFG